MNEIGSVVIYSVLGIVLMFLGSMAIDFLIPCNFSEEIKKGNTAIGFVMAGIYIAVATIVKASVMTYTFTEGKESLLAGITNTVIYFVVGLVLCIVGYRVSDLLDGKYDLNKELGKGNQAAGIMVAGIFIGIAIVISGVIV